MFDRSVFIDNKIPSNVTYNVTEKKAPTDDSVRLLMDMQQKAMDNLLGMVKIENNNFEVTALAFSDWAHFSKLVYLKYTLGTDHHELKITLRQGATEREMINKLVDELSKDIAIHVLEAAISPKIIRTLMEGSIK
jgi:hypothetical protein